VAYANVQPGEVGHGCESGSAQPSEA
jgi:hypothetical protein